MSAFLLHTLVLKDAAKKNLPKKSHFSENMWNVMILMFPFQGERRNKAFKNAWQESLLIIIHWSEINFIHSQYKTLRLQSCLLQMLNLIGKKVQNQYLGKEFFACFNNTTCVFFPFISVYFFKSAYIFIPLMWLTSFANHLKKKSALRRQIKTVKHWNKNAPPLRQFHKAIWASNVAPVLVALLFSQYKANYLVFSITKKSFNGVISEMVSRINIYSPRWSNTFFLMWSLTIFKIIILE